MVDQNSAPDPQNHDFFINSYLQLFITSDYSVANDHLDNMSYVRGFEPEEVFDFLIMKNSDLIRRCPLWVKNFDNQSQLICNFLVPTNPP